MCKQAQEEHGSPNPLLLQLHLAKYCRNHAKYAICTREYSTKECPSHNTKKDVPLQQQNASGAGKNELQPGKGTLPPIHLIQ